MEFLNYASKPRDSKAKRGFQKYMHFLILQINCIDQAVMQRHRIFPWYLRQLGRNAACNVSF
jgi:hypothetical protein